MSDSHEIEVKLRYQRVEQLEQAGLRLELEIARHFEDNWLLDTADRQLSARAAILRVRAAAGRGALTYKAKADPAAIATQFKARLEIETQLDNPQNALLLLEQLGYRKWFRYQKYRTVYRALLPSGASLHLMFDETPLGNFVELEGAENAIVEAVQWLGVRREDYILESYLALQIADCQARGRELEDMIF